MDNTEQLPNVLSLCSGYGGLERGIERVLGEIRVLAHVEIEAFAIANLVNKMETEQMVPAPIWTDLKTLPLEPFRSRVDLLTGGYPCQPFSAAGKRKGEEDPRHLWPYIGRIIRGCGPTWCFFENVEGHVSLGLSSVISDLEEMGYVVTWGIFSASEVGAPHQRKRVFILAHRESYHRGDSGVSETTRQNKSRERIGARGGGVQVRNKCSPQRWPARPGEEQYEWEEPRVVADTEKCDDGERNSRAAKRQRTQHGKGSSPTDVRNPQSVRQQEPGQIKGHSPEPPNRRPVQQTQPELGRIPDGARDRVDRLRLLGNGVVPQTAEKAFRTLLKRFKVLSDAGEV